LDQIDQLGSDERPAGTAEENGTEVGDMCVADNDSSDRVIVLTLKRLLSARAVRPREHLLT
jgi:hypothetical protein